MKFYKIYHFLILTEHVPHRRHGTDVEGLLEDSDKVPEQHGISHSNLSLFRYESIAGGEGSTDAAPEMFTHCPNHTDVGLLTIIPAAQGSSGLNVFSWDSAGILRAQHGTAAQTSDRDSTTPLALNPTISLTNLPTESTRVGRLRERMQRRRRCVLRRRDTGLTREREAGAM